MESDLNHRSDLLIPCRHERRLTLFDIFEWTYIVLGVFTGILFGWKQSGISGGIIGAVVGCLGGILLGRLPLFVGLQLLGTRRKSTEELEAIFRRDQYYIFHLVLPELMSRGIDVSAHGPRVLGLLLSDDSDRRSFGWSCLQLAFPDLAGKLSGFSSEKPSADHLERIRRFKQDAETSARDQPVDS